MITKFRASSEYVAASKNSDDRQNLIGLGDTKKKKHVPRLQEIILYPDRRAASSEKKKT